MKLKVVLEPSEEGGFTVYVRLFPDAYQRETAQATLYRIFAIELYLEPMDDDLAGVGKDVRVMFCDRASELIFSTGS